MLEILLAGAIATSASDIHLEPEEESVRLRFRLDGVLNDITFFDNKLYTQLLSRIKLVSGLKLNIKHTAQDGRFSITLGESNIEIRTSVLPGAYGESIVLRVLNPKSILVNFSDLGIEPSLFSVVEKEIKKPNGLILLTGPTGSGKTTSLYAFLRTINSPESKIITIEDPIEYHLNGINQTQVDKSKDYTFLTGLRSALRQDPDVIMVGEIRDEETAKIAVNASLTGHLVFSTLHTNNAAGTIPRLIDLGVNAKVIDAALNLAIAQRLVRKLCEVCKEKYAPEGAEKKLLEEVRASIVARSPRESSGVASRPVPEITVVYRAKEGGCSACHTTGYRGREGVFEAIIVDQLISKTLSENPNEREIRVAAKGQGLLEMRQDGVLKVLAGSTSLVELGRVVDLSEEII